MEKCSTNPASAHVNGAPIHTDHQQRLEAGQTCLRAALNYLDLGLSVLCLCDPDHVAVGRQHGQECRSPGKMPMHTWKHLQGRVPTEDEVKGYWRHYPLGGVGVALGPVSGLVRIDIDGQDASALLATWSAGELPPTWTFTSGGGGTGLLYAWPRDVPCATTALRLPGQHAELRLMGYGAQTVLPPSRHSSGNLYVWHTGLSPDDLPLAKAPTWLLERLRAEPAPAASHTGTVLTRSGPGVLDQQTRSLMAHGSAVYASRSESLFALLTRLVRHGLDDTSIVALVLDPACLPGAKARERDHRWLAGEIARARRKVHQTITRYHNAGMTAEQVQLVLWPGGATAQARAWLLAQLAQMPQSPPPPDEGDMQQLLTLADKASPSRRRREGDYVDPWLGPRSTWCGVPLDVRRIP